MLLLLLSHFSRVRLYVTPWTAAHQAPLSLEFSRQESWSGLPFPSLGDLPDPGIKPASLALAGGFFATEPPGEPLSGETDMLVIKWQIQCLAWSTNMLITIVSLIMTVFLHPVWAVRDGEAGGSFVCVRGALHVTFSSLIPRAHFWCFRCLDRGVCV